MADAREEVVLDLEVEPAEEPVPHAVVRGEVGRGGHLMHRPFGLDAVVVLQLLHELGIAHHVRQLEHDGDDQPGHEHHDAVADQRVHHAGEEHGQHQEHAHIAQLGGPEHDVLLHRQRLHGGVVRDAAGEVLPQVVVEDPEEVGEPVEQQAVHVLEPVEPLSLLPFMHADPGLDVDVVVHALHVGEGVVVDVVLQLPEVHVAAQEVEREAHDLVHPAAAAVAAVSAVVHHVEADGGDGEAEQGAEAQRHPAGGGGEEDQRDVQRHEHGDQDARLQVEAEVARACAAAFREVGVGDLAQALEELGGLLAELGLYGGCLHRGAKIRPGRCARCDLRHLFYSSSTAKEGQPTWPPAP